MKRNYCLRFTRCVFFALLSLKPFSNERKEIGSTGWVFPLKRKQNRKIFNLNTLGRLNDSREGKKCHLFIECIGIGISYQGTCFPLHTSAIIAFEADCVCGVCVLNS